MASPYAAKPTSLSKPVPNAQEEDDIESVLSQFSFSKQPAMSADSTQASEAAPVEAEEDVDQVVNQVLGQVSPMQAQGAQTAPVTAEIEPEPSFMEANAKQFQDFTTRIQAGLAANDNEKLGMLRNKFGNKNVLVKNGDIYFRKEEKGKFRRLDPDTLELVNDLIPDFAREIVTEAALLPGEVAGAMVSGGNPAGAIAGRVLSTPLAGQAADKVAGMAGVPRDEGRSRLAENAIAMTGEAVLPVVGKQILKRLPGTAAYQAAKQAGEREIVALTKQSQAVANAIDALESEGRVATIRGEMIGIPEANVPLMGHHLNPDSPKLQRFANIAKSDPRFINAENQLAQDWGELLNNTLTEIGRRGSPGPYKPEVLASKVVNAVDDVRKAEGQAIDAYKAKAMAALKNQKQPLPPEIAQQVTGIMRELGFSPKQVKTESILRRSVPDLAGGAQDAYKKNFQQKLVWKAPKDLRPYVGKYGLTSVDQVRSVVNTVSELSKGLDGGFRIQDLERMRNITGDLSNTLYGTRAGAEVSSLARGLRNSFRDTITRGLDNEVDQKAFANAMDEFSALQGNLQVLKGALNENASSKAIVSTFFNGKENLEKIKAIKKVSPESFANLKSEFVNQMLVDYASRETKSGVKSTAFLDAMNKKYGDQFLKEVLNDGGPGPNLDTVKNILKVTERIDIMSKGRSADVMSEEQKKGLMNIAIGLFADVKFKTVNGITSMFQRGGEDNAILQIMTRDGIEKYVSNYPGKINKKDVVSTLNNVLAHSKVFGALDEPLVKRAAKRTAIDQGLQTKQKFSKDVNIAPQDEAQEEEE